MKKILIISAFLFVSCYSQEYKPGDHEVLIMPTAFTMPKGSGYFTDYELFLISGGYAITSTTHISAAVVLPVVENFYKSATLGIKQNYFRSSFFSGALFCSLTFESVNFVIGNVFTLGIPERNFNIGIAYYSQLDNTRNSQVIYMLGSKFDVSESVSLLAEYENANEAFSTDFGGLLSLGVRFKSGNLSWEIAGLRPLEKTSGSLLFLPLVKATLIL